MEKEQLRSFKDKQLIYRGEGSLIYRLPDHRILKVAQPLTLNTCRLVGASYEGRILNTRAQKVSEIVRPITAVYDNSNCVAYTQEDIVGKTLNEYDDQLTTQQRSDLHHYYELYRKIENAVKKANEAGIVIPDLCTCDNILVLPDGSIKLIDYDGMQVGPRDRCVALSTSLGDPAKYLFSAKYCDEPFHLSAEIDKTSLTMLMFLVVFNIDLTKIGQRNPITGSILTLKEVFQMIRITDPLFMKKVEANISTEQKGTYLQDELYKIACNYDMMAIPFPIKGEGAHVKILQHK